MHEQTHHGAGNEHLWKLLKLIGFIRFLNKVGYSIAYMQHMMSSLPKKMLYNSFPKTVPTCFP